MVTSSTDHNDWAWDEHLDQTYCTEQEKPRITVFTRFYPPAYLGGGPTRSVHALVQALGADFRFSVVTSAFDSFTGPMQSVKPCRWTARDHARIWYESRRRMAAGTVAKLLKQTDPQLVFLNSLFDYQFGILPLLVTRSIFRGVPIILAPRGELSAGALSLKPFKKRAYIALFRALSFHKTVIWQASTSLDKADIERVFGANVRTHVAINICRVPISDSAERCQGQVATDDQQTGSLIFFSRIVPMKNVTTVIQAIQLVKGNINLSIAGPIEDGDYWKRCLKLINDMPEPGLVRYLGTIHHEEVVDFLNRFDLLVLPTLGENFGHVVLESLAAGTPVIVGRDTPWHNIETSGAGWTCDPNKPEEIAELIEHFLALDKGAHERMRMAARNLALRMLDDSSSADTYRRLLCAVTCTEPA